MRIKPTIMARTNQEKELIENLDRIEGALSATHTLVPGDLCKKYAEIRPWLLTVIAIVEKIPFLGKVTVALKFLMQLADQLCHVG